MRVLALLALAGVVAAGTCTESVLYGCTPAFQFDGDDAFCYYLDIAKGELWRRDDSTACNQSVDFDFGAASKIASTTTPYTLDGGALVYTTSDSCNETRRAGSTVTWAIKFQGAPSNTNPAVGGSGCGLTLTVYVPSDGDDCNAPAGTGGSSRRRNSASGGRRNSASGSRRNSASSTNGDDNLRSGCVSATNPLFPLLNYSLAPCQKGQCCGANFCNRDRNLGDCIALGANGVADIAFTVGSFCGDSTCKPVYGGNSSGANGAGVKLGSSLAHAVGALPEGGYLEVLVKNVNTPGEVPAFANGEILVSFEVNRKESADGGAATISGYLPDGTWIEITVESDALNGADVTVWRWDETASAYVDSADDCASINSAVEISIDGNVYTVPICHTSQFIVTLSADGDDKDDKDHKHVKGTKKSPKTKVKTASKGTKAPKSVAKKSEAKGKGKKVEIGVGVGVAGAAVAAAGVAFFARRRNNKKAPKTTTPVAAEAVAVVSV